MSDHHHHVSATEPARVALGDARASGSVANLYNFDEPSSIDRETLTVLEAIAGAGLPEHYRAACWQTAPRRQQRGRARRTARRTARKSSSKSDDGDPEPPGTGPLLVEADPRHARHPGGPRFQYEERTCAACGGQFRNYWADSRPMARCSACCESCDEDGSCPECGADTGADRGGE